MARAAKAAKPRHVYICQSCGHQEAKWLGRCPGCQEWSSLVEELPAAPVALHSRAARGLASASTAVALPLSQISIESGPRFSTGIVELDRVLGGGLVDGALTLVGGDPGIGKSTLLLQALGEMATAGLTVLYATSEESLAQVKLRADRLGVDSERLYLLADTSLDSVDQARCHLKPKVMVIDSVQTMAVASIESTVGSVSQIRGVTQHLMDIAKSQDVAIFVVGHVTKDGAIAGPKVMEHMVDTVLYFEGDRTGPYRILRAHKNRFGSAQEIGVFEMHAEGLRPVANPSEIFLAQRAQGPGAAVITSVEGSRPILLEVQALVTPSPYGMPRRTTTGFEQQRVAMLCAVLAARAGMSFADLDVYVNVAGGVRVTEPAADLGVIAALASTVRDIALPEDAVLVGEIGLSGEIRGVTNLLVRVQEAASLGFSRCVVPQIDLDRGPPKDVTLPLIGARHVRDVLELFGLQ